MTTDAPEKPIQCGQYDRGGVETCRRTRRAQT
jgi:hypothetical protein